MTVKAKLIHQVKDIVEADPTEVRERVRRFQDQVWNETFSDTTTEVAEVLRDLAYDLDFFVEDRAKRLEDPSYYGRDRLNVVVQAALSRLKDPVERSAEQ